MEVKTFLELHSETDFISLAGGDDDWVFIFVWTLPLINCFHPSLLYFFCFVMVSVSVRFSLIFRVRVLYVQTQSNDTFVRLLIPSDFLSVAHWFLLESLNVDTCHVFRCRFSHWWSWRTKYFQSAAKAKTLNSNSNLFKVLFTFAFF